MSPRLADELRPRIPDVVHVRERGLQAASDVVILRNAVAERRVLISLDGDFSALLALGELRWPSFVHLRTPGLGNPVRQAVVVLQALELAYDELATGAIVTIRGEQIRVRRLPIR